MTQEEKIQALRDLGYKVQIIDGKPTIKGYLYLCNTDITSLPDNLVVRGDLNLNNTRITSLPDNLVVGGWLDLCDTKIKSLPNNLVVGDCLFLNGTAITSLPDNLIVGADFYLSYSEIRSLPDNFVVRGWLGINGTKIKSLPDNLVIGNWIDIRETEITSLPDNLAIGSGIIKSNGDKIYTNQNINIDFVQKIWGDKPYCKVDGIFTEVVNRRGKVWTVRNIGETETFYIVNDGNGNYAHGETIKEAKESLIYKITSRDKSAYKDLTFNSILPYEEAIQCYRVITGACSFGTKNFVENILPPDKRKEQYTIAEMIRLTKGQYGNETFANFFKNNK